MLGDIEYFRKRLVQEAALAVNSDSEQVRAVHRRLSELYAERLAALGAIDEVFPIFQHATPNSGLRSVGR